MGFKKIENFFKKVNAKIGPKREKVTKNRCWHAFCHYFFLQSTSIMLFHILLERATKTEENGIYFLKTCLYLISILPLYLLPLFRDISQKENRKKIVTFSSFQLFKHVICHFEW